MSQDLLAVEPIGNVTQWCLMNNSAFETRSLIYRVESTRENHEC